MYLHRTPDPDNDPLRHNHTHTNSSDAALRGTSPYLMIYTRNCPGVDLRLKLSVSLFSTAPLLFIASLTRCRAHSMLPTFSQRKLTGITLPHQQSEYVQLRSIKLYSSQTLTPSRSTKDELAQWQMRWSPARAQSLMNSAATYWAYH